jgi:hypothetical protein
MSTLHLNATKETPEVLFDAIPGIFKLSGNSIPENSQAFYSILIDWFLDNKNTLHFPVDLHFNLDYFNSATSKQIVLLLSSVAKNLGHDNLKVSWHYDIQDEDVLATGKRFEALTNLKFEYLQLG